VAFTIGRNAAIVAACEVHRHHTARRLRSCARWRRGFG